MLIQLQDGMYDLSRGTVLWLIGHFPLPLNEHCKQYILVNYTDSKLILIEKSLLTLSGIKKKHKLPDNLNESHFSYFKISADNKIINSENNSVKLFLSKKEMMKYNLRKQTTF